MPVYLVVLGCDYNQDKTAIGQKTCMRCLTALYSYMVWSRCGTETFLVLAAGRQTGDEEHTMASLMADWFIDQEVPQSRLLVNVRGDITFDTIGEVGWALPTIKAKQRELNAADPESLALHDMGRALVVFVSNGRHLWRTWCTLKLLHNPRLTALHRHPDGYTGDEPTYDEPVVDWERSEEEPPTLWHELKAYVKLCLIKHKLLHLLPERYRQ